MRDLRSYQREAVEAVEAQFLGGVRSTLIVMATGGGKTRVAGEIIKRHLAATPNGRVLWLTHTGELVTQSARSLERDVGVGIEIEKAEQRATVHGLFGGLPIVVATVQSLRGSRLNRFPPTAFTLIVLDEAHHAASKTWRDVITHFAAAKVLGLTATPDRGDKVGLGAVFQSVAFTYEIRQAIKGGYLVNPIIKTIEVADLDISDVRSQAGDLNQGDLEKAMTIDAVLHQIAAPLVREAGDRRTVIFTVSVAQSKALADVIAGYVDSPSKVAQIDGETPPELRHERIAGFCEGRIQFLVNCMILTEGFDAPETSCVAMCRPTKSRALYTQAVGRGLRLAPDKVDALILDFVGVAGKHALVTPLDVLAGKPLPEDVKKRANELAADGKPSEDAITQAEAEAVERERQLEEKRRRAAKVKADVAYRARQVDPFRVMGVERGETGPRATEAQLDALRRAKIPLDYIPSRREASAMIDRLKERRSKGLATYAQARQLVKRGLPGDRMTFEEARRALDAIANNGWRVPQVVADYCHGKYGQEAAE